MLPQTKIEEVEKLLAEGNLSRRKIALLTGVCRSVVTQIALGERPDYTRQLEPDANRLEPTGDIERCPTCGAKVYMPCRLCHLRKATEEGTLKRYRRRAKQKASRRLLAAIVRRQHVEQVLATDATVAAVNRTETSRIEESQKEYP